MSQLQQCTWKFGEALTCMHTCVGWTEEDMAIGPLITLSCPSLRRALAGSGSHCFFSAKLASQQAPGTLLMQKTRVPRTELRVLMLTASSDAPFACPAVSMNCPSTPAIHYIRTEIPWAVHSAVMDHRERSLLNYFQGIILICGLVDLGLRWTFDFTVLSNQPSRSIS